jgi:hypothetical protein
MELGFCQWMSTTLLKIERAGEAEQTDAITAETSGRNRKQRKKQPDISRASD